MIEKRRVSGMNRTFAFKTALAAVSLLLVASMGGGFLLLPIVVPLHVWAARTSGPTGRVLWPIFPVTAAVMSVWALTYVAAGEAKPAIWLLPLLAGTAATLAMRRLTLRTSPHGAT